MYSNRYVALHCCQEKYYNEIKESGISRASKAVFIIDLESIDKNEIYNTLAVMFYHGIGIDGWTKILNDNKKLNDIDKHLIISIAKISKEQEKTIKNKELWNYYKIIDGNEKTLKYLKIKDIGAVKNIVYEEKQKLYSKNIIKNNDINPLKDRFFIKNTYNDCEIKNTELAVKNIQKVCYKMAEEKLNAILEDVFKIN